jgi:G3E family GTPase
VSADEIILTKIDLAQPDTMTALIARLQAINPTTRLTTAVFGQVEGRHVLSCRDSRTLAAQLARMSKTVLGASGTPSAHSGERRSLALSFAQPLDWIAFSIWLSMLLHARGEEPCVSKGF